MNTHKHQPVKHAGLLKRLRPHPFATMIRITKQLKHDPRTVALVLVVPALLIALLYYVFSDVPTPPGGKSTFDTLGPIMLAVLPMMLMFIVTSVVMLRERTSGTLERVLTTPISKWNLIVSYATVFGLLAGVQALILSALILGPMGATLEGPWPVLILLALLDAVFGVAFGLLASAFARTEFQAVQFMPLFIGPQLFLCGLFVPAAQMPHILENISAWLPMTWAADVVTDLTTNTHVSSTSWWHLAALAAAAIAALVVAAATMPRKTR